MAKAMLPKDLTVPLHMEQFCGNRNPRTNKLCRRAEGHKGRHAFIWRFYKPGAVREVWGDCQMCGRPTTDGAVCRSCGA